LERGFGWRFIRSLRSPINKNGGPHRGAAIFIGFVKK